MTEVCVTTNSHLFNIEYTINIVGMFASNISNNQTELINIQTINFKTNTK